jgi:hypothetical protein
MQLGGRSQVEPLTVWYPTKLATVRRLQFCPCTADRVDISPESNGRIFPLIAAHSFASGAPGARIGGLSGV